MATPIVAIVGRPNVGKSSLFNRILGRRQAIVSDVAGTTRDRLLGEVSWGDYRFILIDTGGLEANPEGTVRQKVQEQVGLALADADVVIFVTDVAEGLTPTDEVMAERLRRTHKPLVLAVNKVDNEARELGATEFHQLGLGDVVLISAYHNLGIFDLMEWVVAHLPPPQSQEENEEASQGELKLAIVGRTNVGKSMLLNAILGQERAIVSEVPGTTRDALDTQFSYDGQDILLIDTAGIRRPGRVAPGIEKYSVLRAVSALSRSDIALLVTDATGLATAQDAHIAGLAWEMCRGLIVVVNKWDLIPQDDAESRGRAVGAVGERFHFMPYVPVCFTSALRCWGIDALMQTSLELGQERWRRVPANRLQHVLIGALADHMPPPVKGHAGQRLRIDGLRQVDVNPPTFLFTVNNPQLVHFSYQRFLENRLRASFGFDRTHLRLVFKRRG
ncbi:MAG: ribosome biogenesis GTPase Der [Chloroflexota bacterium]